jgi:hypothetical protein
MMRRMNSQRAICVYCSASSDVAACYFQTASELGRLIAERFGTLVFGGNNVGCMNTLAAAVHEAGGRVIGITPELMHDQGLSYAAADELIVTSDMRQRKATMEARAEAFVILPGGFGTMEEFFEILVGRLLGYHDKPIVLVNAEGFYDPLLELFEHMYAKRFAREKYRNLYTVAATAAEAVDALSGALDSATDLPVH